MGDTLTPVHFRATCAMIAPREAAFIEALAMAFLGWSALRGIFIVHYAPEPTLRTFLDRAETQHQPAAEVTVGVLDSAESARLFGVPLSRRRLQPVFLRVANRGTAPLRLQIVCIDPNYFTPLEAARLNHYALRRWLAVFGILGWFMLPLLLPLLIVILPIKWVSARRANRRMDECFRSQAFSLRPIAPGATSEGFIFTRLDSGTKSVHVCLHEMGNAANLAAELAEAAKASQGAPTSHPSVLPPIEFTFSIAVPGIKVDYHRRDFQKLFAPETIQDCHTLPMLVEKLQAMPATTTNKKDTGTGDPVNLVVVGKFDTIVSAFAGRWDETEVITFATSWKTFRSFLLGSEYRYSPVSPLYLFGRSQDVALQRSRRSINERVHLRLWLVPIRFLNQPVWVGQVSRDIGVRFTMHTWNLTTHRIDPEVDEARDYVIEDLLEAQRLQAAGYVDGVGSCDRVQPRRNLTGDPYFTDGKRGAVLVSSTRTAPKFVAW